MTGNMSSKQRAFILRIAPKGKDRLDEALRANELIIGWSEARGLLEESLSWVEFRQIIHDAYYSKDSDYRRSGLAAGSMWRFIREMQISDFVVVPHGSKFYLAEITTLASHNETKVSEDTAYRRSVHWLNNKKPIPRRIARVRLQLRMKVQQTCANADDLIEDIKDIIHVCAKGEEPTFEGDLQQRLTEEALEEIRSGRINDSGFERLIGNVLCTLGARDVRVIPKKLDKGADVIGTFMIANTFKFILAVQAKHFSPKPPVSKEAIEQLLRGMEAESADLGWVVTSGSFSEEAIKYTNELLDEQGLKIELIDGEQLASLIIERGLKISSEKVTAYER